MAHTEEVEESIEQATTHDALADESLAVAPAKQHFRWINQTVRPYADFKEEFEKSPIELDEATLIRRWQGITPKAEIQAFFRQEWIILDRQRARIESLKDTGFNPADPIYQNGQNMLDLVDGMKRKAKVQKILDEGMIDDLRLEEDVMYDEYGEMMVKANGTPVMQHREVWYKRPLKPSEIARLSGELRELKKEARLLTEQATQIGGDTQSVTVTINDMLKSALVENSAEYRQLTGSEANGHSNGRSGNGRMIDVTDQTDIKDVTDDKNDDKDTP